MKILIIGTSNIGALKYASGQIEQEYPEADVTFYGLPGGRFNTVTARNGVFGPRRAETELVAMSKRINGVPRIDIQQFDHVFVISDTLGLAPILWVTVKTDIVDWPTRRDLPLISEAAFNDALQASVYERVDHLRAQFAETPLHVARAPYPTVAVARFGPHRQRPYAEMAVHPEASRIEDLYNSALAAILTDRGMKLIPQPSETIAQPFLTKEHYGQGAMDFRDDGIRLDDHRHMNADFGASLFRTFALSIGLSEAAPQT